MAKKPMKFKRYDEGGEVADKEAGLKASKDEDVGFFKRLRMGNIDDPTSEAYKRFGAGRGRSERTPVNESVSVNEPMSMPVARPSMKTTADDMYSDYGVKAGRGSAGTSETMSPSAATPSVKPSMPKPVIASRPKISTAMMEANNPVGSGGNYPESRVARRSYNEPPVGNAHRDEEKESKTPAKASSSRVPTSEQAAANRSAAVDKIKKAGSSISDFFSNYETPAERRNREKKEKAAKGSYASGGSVSSASRRADGIATKGKTRGKMC